MSYLAKQNPSLFSPIAEKQKGKLKFIYEKNNYMGSLSQVKSSLPAVSYLLFLYSMASPLQAVELL